MGYGDIRLSQTVSKSNYLELTNGLEVTSLTELLVALKEMDEETFSHHVSKNNNDFAEWIFENYGDERVTRRVLEITKRQKLIKYLEKILKKDIKEFNSDRESEDRGPKKIRRLGSRKKVLEKIKNGE